VISAAAQQSSNLVVLLRRAEGGVRAAWVVLGCCLAILVIPSTRGAETLLPSPPNHFNDFAGAVPPATAQELDRELAQFERDTSNQIVVAIYPHQQSSAPIEDYAVRLFQAWGVGQKGRNNGALLLMFTQDHKMWITTGYGLEGAMPDALCKRIIEDEIAPRLRAGDFGGGLSAGVHAMIGATRGEYKGTGRTVHDSQSNGSAPFVALLPFIVFGVFLLLMIFGRNRQRGRSVYGRSGRTIITPPFWGGWGGGSGSGGWSGGSSGGFGGGGGGFSGGGGSTGGGGAGGSW
jgi:uncharacterized protein